MNNQLPENNMPQNDSKKIENVFEALKKPKILNWVNWVILAVIVLVTGGMVWYYSNSRQEQTTKDYYQELDDKYPKDYQGAYAAEYPYGTERLILKSDGVYEQLFAFNGEILHTINSGNWEIRNIGEKQLVLLGPVIVDNGFGKPTNLEKKNGIWPLHIKKSITGKIYFPINEDLDFEFNSEASERIEEKIVFFSQEECEQKTGQSCHFQNCDFIPLDKTFEEVCGKDFKKGWVPKNPVLEQTPPEKQKIIGKIIFSDIEGGCWGFQDDNGKYFLIGGDDKSEEIKKIPDIFSKKVEIQGKIEKDIVHFCPVGDGLFKLESYRIIDDNATSGSKNF